MTDEQAQRQGQPHEDDFPVQRIEIEFAMPVYLPVGFQRELDGLLTSLVNMRMNQPTDGVHWVSGHGAKPSWSKADARFLGKSVADDAPERGEPTFDDSVYHIETTARPLHPGEQGRHARRDGLFAALKAAQPAFCSLKCPSGPDSARHIPECVAMQEAIARGVPMSNEPMDISVELHRILGSFGIASLSNRLAGLPGALILWAAQACRQSQSAELAQARAHLAQCRKALKAAEYFCTPEVARGPAIPRWEETMLLLDAALALPASEAKVDKT